MARAAAATTNYKAIFPFVALDGRVDLVNLLVGEVAAVEGITATASVTLDPAKGSIAIFHDSDGVTPSMEPRSGSGPWYLVGAGFVMSDTGSPEPGLTAFLNADPGDVEFTMSRDTKTCTHIGWATDRPNTQRAPIRAEHLTSLRSATCL